jgi:hypothetical protein
MKFEPNVLEKGFLKIKNKDIWPDHKASQGQGKANGTTCSNFACTCFSFEKSILLKYHLENKEQRA